MQPRTNDSEAASLRARRASSRRYSLMIRFGKWLLPLGALGVLASIFLSGAERGGLEDMLSAEEIARLGAGLRLEQPRFVGRTTGGQPFELSAEAAEPDSALAEEIVLIKPEGRLTLAGGRILTGSAEGGLMRRTAETLTLTGGVRIETDDGYRFDTAALTVFLSRRDATAPGAVRGTGPAGTLEAARMVIMGTADGEADPAAAVIRFEGGVRVLFTPPKKH
ncbi:MAG: LPS export ABC transporter periplasmic protein LptC [Pseudomonadota bacterium]